MNERSENVALPTDENLLRDKASSNGRMPVAAVPSDGMHAPYDGITKREYFAGLAMQGQCANSIPGNHHSFENTAREAVQFADALLKELAK